MDERAHRLIDRIYAAALDPEVWQEVTEEFSALFGGAPTMLGFLMPGELSLGPRYFVGLDEDYLADYLPRLLRDVPWSTKYMAQFADRWGDMGEVIGHVNLAETEFYTEWLKPQGLAAVWPGGHTVVSGSGDPIGGFTVFRREGEPPFSEEEFAAADVFIPHVRRSIQVHLTVHGAQRVRLALAEAIDRLPTGVLLLDARRRVVIQNKGAERIVSADDGFRVDRTGPSAEDARENAVLQRLIADAMDARRGQELDAAGFVAISRPSEKRAYAVMVTPLIAPPGGSVVSDAVVAIFVSDPTARPIAGPEVLEELYQLTHSEAELVRLLAAGLSLEEAAESRGVSLNTARSHLKHAFAKTGTSRQGELVRLVVTGVGQIREG